MRSALLGAVRRMRTPLTSLLSPLDDSPVSFEFITCITPSLGPVLALLPDALGLRPPCRVVLVSEALYAQQEQADQQRVQQREQKGAQLLPAPVVVVFAPIDGGCRHGWDIPCQVSLGGGIGAFKRAVHFTLDVGNQC